jgi:hypothetical protein
MLVKNGRFLRKFRAILNAGRKWQINVEVIRYQNEPDYPIERLIAAYSESESMVGDVPFNQPTIAPIFKANQKSDKSSGEPAG